MLQSKILSKAILRPQRRRNTQACLGLKLRGSDESAGQEHQQRQHVLCGRLACEGKSSAPAQSADMSRHQNRLQGRTRVIVIVKPSGSRAVNP